MNAEAFTLKARRTTRVPLRVPVQLGIEEGGAPKSLDGWTVIVNIHGAKIESKRRMQLNETVKVTVPLTRKTQSGRVVWASEQASHNGNFEFAIELTEPGNLWGVGFPPSDWKEVKAAAAAAGPVAVASKPAAAPLMATSPLVPEENLSALAPSLPAPAAEEAKPAAKKITVAGYKPEPIAPFTVNKPGAASTQAVPVLHESIVPAKEPVAMVELSAPSPVQPSAVAGEVVEIAPAPLAAAQPEEVSLPELPMELPEMVVEAEPAPQAGALLPEMEMLEAAPAGPAMQVEESSSEMMQWMSGRVGETSAQPAPLPIEQLFAGPAESVAAEPAQTLEMHSAATPALPELELAPAAPVEQAERALELPLEIPAVHAAPAQSVEQGQVLEVSIPDSGFTPVRATSAASAEAPTATIAALELACRKSLAQMAESAESAFQKRMQGIIEQAGEKAGAQLAVKLAEMERVSLEQIEQRLNTSCDAHFERLDQRFETLLENRLGDFEQRVTKCADDAGETARERQQEIISRSEQDLRRRAAEISLHSQGQVQRHAAEAVEAAQSSMAARLQDLLPAIEQAQKQATDAVNAAQESLKARLEELAPAIEQQVSEQIRRAAEQIHYLQRGQFEATLSSRIEEARGYLQQHLDTVQQDASGRLQETVEKCMEQQSRLLLQQMETALTQMAGQVQKTFFKHVVEELSRQQQTWMVQTQRRMENLADRGMQQVRQQMMQLLGAMGEALVRDSLPEEELAMAEAPQAGSPL